MPRLVLRGTSNHRRLWCLLLHRILESGRRGGGRRPRWRWREGRRWRRRRRWRQRGRLCERLIDAQLHAAELTVRPTPVLADGGDGCAGDARLLLKARDALVAAPRLHAAARSAAIRVGRPARRRRHRATTRRRAGAARRAAAAGERGWWQQPQDIGGGECPQHRGLLGVGLAPVLEEAARLAVVGVERPEEGREAPPQQEAHHLAHPRRVVLRVAAPLAHHHRADPARRHVRPVRFPHFGQVVGVARVVEEDQLARRRRRRRAQRAPVDVRAVHELVAPLEAKRPRRRVLHVLPPVELRRPALLRVAIVGDTLHEDQPARAVLLDRRAEPLRRRRPVEPRVAAAPPRAVRLVEEVGAHHVPLCAEQRREAPPRRVHRRLGHQLVEPEPARLRPDRADEAVHVEEHEDPRRRGAAHQQLERAERTRARRLGVAPRRRRGAWVEENVVDRHRQPQRVDAQRGELAHVIRDRVLPQPVGHRAAALEAKPRDAAQLELVPVGHQHAALRCEVGQAAVDGRRPRRDRRETRQREPKRRGALASRRRREAERTHAAFAEPAIAHRLAPRLARRDGGVVRAAAHAGEGRADLRRGLRHVRCAIREMCNSWFITVTTVTVVRRIKL